MDKGRWCPEDINELVRLSRSSPGCMGYERCNNKQLRLAYDKDKMTQASLDVWIDAGATIVGQSPLKGNELDYPYERILIEWPEEPPHDFRTRERIHECPTSPMSTPSSSKPS